MVELGILSLKLKKAFDIEQDVFYADIHWDNLMKAVKKVNLTYTDISKYPSVSRDLALLVDKNVEFAQIEQIARQTEKKNVADSILLRRGEAYDEEEIAKRIGMPCFVKPAADGSSFGVSKVKNADQLAPALRVAFCLTDLAFPSAADFQFTDLHRYSRCSNGSH